MPNVNDPDWLKTELFHALMCCIYALVAAAVGYYLYTYP